MLVPFDNKSDLFPDNKVTFSFREQARRMRRYIDAPPPGPAALAGRGAPAAQRVPLENRRE